MPTYVYACGSCGKQFEKYQSFKEDALTVCICGQEGQVRRVIQPIGVVFKGSGWYVNDSRSGNGTVAASDASKAEKPEGDAASTVDKADKADKAEKTDKTEKAEKTEKTEKSEPAVKADTPAASDAREKSDKRASSSPSSND